MNLDKTRVLLFAHDSGGANAVLAYGMTLREQGAEVKAYPKGPGIGIFKKNAPFLIDDKKPVFGPPCMVITGLSGNESNYELEMIKTAREQGVKKIISIMDVSYYLDLRFTLNGEIVGPEYLPDEIWIPEIVETSEKEEINAILVKKENPYWEYVRKTCYAQNPLITNDLVREHKNSYLLYLTEYIQEQYGTSLGYTEFSLLEDFLTAALQEKPGVPVFIKLHPQEAPDKYEPVLARFQESPVYLFTDSLQQLLFYAKAVFGFSSTVFYESSKILQRPSYSLQLSEGLKKEIDSIKCLPASVIALCSSEELKKALSAL